jgi:hypothetical protein
LVGIDKTKVPSGSSAIEKQEGAAQVKGGTDAVVSEDDRESEVKSGDVGEVGASKADAGAADAGAADAGAGSSREQNVVAYPTITEQNIFAADTPDGMFQGTLQINDSEIASILKPATDGRKPFNYGPYTEYRHLRWVLRQKLGWQGEQRKAINITFPGQNQNGPKIAQHDRIHQSEKAVVLNISGGPQSGFVKLQARQDRENTDTVEIKFSRECFTDEAEFTSWLESSKISYTRTDPSEYHIAWKVPGGNTYAWAKRYIRDKLGDIKGDKFGIRSISSKTKEDSLLNTVSTINVTKAT